MHQERLSRGTGLQKEHVWFGNYRKSSQIMIDDISLPIYSLFILWVTLLSPFYLGGEKSLDANTVEKNNRMKMYITNWYMLLTFSSFLYSKFYSIPLCLK